MAPLGGYVADGTPQVLSLMDLGDVLARGEPLRRRGFLRLDDDALAALRAA